MKTILPALALLAVLLGLCFWNSGTMERDSLRWQEQLDEADRLIRAEQWAEACAALNESHRDWTACQSRLRVVCNHALLDDAEALYQRVIAFASVADQAELLADLSALQKQLDLLALREQLRTDNIL